MPILTLKDVWNWQDLDNPPGPAPGGPPLLVGDVLHRIQPISIYIMNLQAVEFIVVEEDIAV